jgi:hypothetical protein
LTGREKELSRFPEGDFMQRDRRLSPTAARGLALIAALLLLVLSLTVLAPPRAEALPACGTHYKYYSSASLTTQVGYRYYTCQGVLASSWGTVTIYKIVNTYCCTA